MKRRSVYALLGVCLLTMKVFAFEDSRYKKAEKEMDAGNFAISEVLYREILTTAPEDSKAQLGLSYVLIKQRNFAKAYDEALKVLKKDQLNARANALVATALLRSGYFVLAYEHLRIALQQGVRDPLALASAAEIDLYENRPHDAYEKLRLATYLEGEEPDFWLLYARTASRLDYYKDAADALRKFLRYSPRTDVERRERISGVIKFYTYLGNSNIYRISGKSATIPFRLKGRRPHVQLKINNKEMVRFVVDTGAGVTVISATAAKRLGVKEVARGGNAYAVGGTGSFPIVYGVIDELAIGEIKIRTVPVYIRQIHSSGTAPEDVVDGYLGLAILSNFLTTLDYPENQLMVEKKEVFQQAAVKDEAEHSILPFRVTESGLISVEVKLEDAASCNFLLDSGASSSVLAAEVIDKQNWQNKILANESIRIVGAAGIADNVKLAFVHKLQVADLLRERLRMPILDFTSINENSGFEQQGILGGDFLSNCKLRIDFDRLQISIAPTSALKKVSVPNALEAKE